MFFLRLDELVLLVFIDKKNSSKSHKDFKKKNVKKITTMIQILN